MNILVIKIGALGDVLRTTFIAQALKDKFKKENPKIFWITSEKAKPLFVNNPYVDSVVLDKDKERLKDISFHLVVNLEEDKENCTFAYSLRPKNLIGFYYKQGKILPTSSAKEWFDMSALGEKPNNDILKKQNKKTHRQILSEIIMVENYGKYKPFLRLTKKQNQLTNNFLRRYNISRDDLIVGINTGSADRWPKQLSIKKTTNLIDELYKKYNAKILLFGGPNEIDRNNEILKLTRSPVITTGCGNDLLEFPALISVCSIFITTDSLGLHVALALKRKTICLVGPTSSAEIDMYGLGKKIVAKSKCVCCYKSTCNSMDKIDLKEVFYSINTILIQKITVLITAFKEPNIDKAIESVVNQKTRQNYEIIVSAPDEETLDIVRDYSKKYKNINIMEDPGKGKSYALNMAFNKINTDILILTDGDVRISENAIEEISNLFLDPQIGCVTGRPVPVETKNTKYGYWANFLFGAAHRWRKEAFANESFIECSGYLFAFRKKHIDKIPLDVAEDSIIPYYFWEEGYKIGYSEDALVYVKNPDNWKDWMMQKTRTAKAHETLDKYTDIKITPRLKTFKNELKGIHWALGYPKSIKEMFWTIQLIFARLYMWFKVFNDLKLRDKHYKDAWERIESTK